MMYKQREIVLVPFPYSDLSAVKRRPVLIISNNSYNKKFPDTLACVITTNLFKDEYSLSLKDSDLEIGFLPEASIIKCHKLFTIEQSKLLKRFSILSEAKFHEVVNVFDKLIEKLN